MHADASHEEFTHSRDLGQLFVRAWRMLLSALCFAFETGYTFQPRESLLNRDMDLALLACNIQIDSGQTRRIGFTSLLAECKDDNGQQIDLLEMIDQLRPEIPVHRTSTAV